MNSAAALAAQMAHNLVEQAGALQVPFHRASCDKVHVFWVAQGEYTSQKCSQKMSEFLFLLQELLKTTPMNLQRNS